MWANVSKGQVHVTCSEPISEFLQVQGTVFWTPVSASGLKSTWLLTASAVNKVPMLLQLPASTRATAMDTLHFITRWKYRWGEEVLDVCRICKRSILLHQKSRRFFAIKSRLREVGGSNLHIHQICIKKIIFFGWWWKSWHSCAPFFSHLLLILFIKTISQAICYSQGCGQTKPRPPITSLKL